MTRVKTSRRPAQHRNSPAALAVVENIAAASPEVVQPAIGYGRDLFERWVLFLDTLRERGNNMIDHQRQGMPPLLDFRFETILDARRFDTPANYALVRVIETGGACWEDRVDKAKRRAR